MRMRWSPLFAWFSSILSDASSPSVIFWCLRFFLCVLECYPENKIASLAVKKNNLEESLVVFLGLEESCKQCRELLIEKHC